MTELSKNLGNVDFDGLLTDITPAATVRGVTLAAPEAETTLKRGTLLCLGESGYAAAEDADAIAPDGAVILCDDHAYSAQTTVSVYASGCFDPAKVCFADGTALLDGLEEGDASAEALLALRKSGLYFKAAQK